MILHKILSNFGLILRKQWQKIQKVNTTVNYILPMWLSAFIYRAPGLNQSKL